MKNCDPLGYHLRSKLGMQDDAVLSDVDITMRVAEIVNEELPRYKVPRFPVLLVMRLLRLCRYGLDNEEAST